jgi:hypothetical protein
MRAASALFPLHISENGRIDISQHGDREPLVNTLRITARVVRVAGSDIDR